MPKKPSFSSLFEYYQIFHTLHEDSVLPLSKISDIEGLFKIHHSKKYELFYSNKSNINKILNDSYNISNISYYIYNFKFIEDINGILNSNVSEVKKFILSIIVIELIDNYRALKDFYDDRFKTKLEEIYNTNTKFISNYFNNSLKYIK